VCFDAQHLKTTNSLSVSPTAWARRQRTLHKLNLPGVTLATKESQQTV
jgi:hypothetical protein